MQETGTVNLNALGDDHVSFSASHLALSPDGQFLLASTDGPRLLMLRVKGVFVLVSLPCLRPAVISTERNLTELLLQTGAKPETSMDSQVSVELCACLQGLGMQQFSLAGISAQVRVCVQWRSSISPQLRGTHLGATSWRQQQLGTSMSSQ